jgi:hypothetical protein
LERYPVPASGVNRPKQRWIFDKEYGNYHHLICVYSMHRAAER